MKLKTYQCEQLIKLSCFSMHAAVSNYLTASLLLHASSSPPPTPVSTSSENMLFTKEGINSKQYCFPLANILN